MIIHVKKPLKYGARARKRKRGGGGRETRKERRLCQICVDFFPKGSKCRTSENIFAIRKFYLFILQKVILYLIIKWLFAYIYYLLVVMSIEYANEDTVSGHLELDDSDVDILNVSLHNLSLEGKL